MATPSAEERERRRLQIQRSWSKRERLRRACGILPDSDQAVTNWSAPEVDTCGLTDHDRRRFRNEQN